VTSEDCVDDFSSYANTESLWTRDEWIARLGRSFPNLAAEWHAMSNPIVNVTGDVAECTVHMQARHVRATSRGDGTYDLGGYYEFRLRRGPARWVITRLKHVVTWEAGNPRIMQEAMMAAEDAERTP
jgi:hypothetical protein